MSAATSTVGWGRRWLDAIGLAPTVDRVAVDDLTIEVGVAAGTVAIDGAHRARLHVAALDDRHWEMAVRVVAGSPELVAAIVTGDVPPELAAALLPAASARSTSCTCGSSAERCVHVATLHRHLADAFDHDPFALTLLRGRGRDALTGAVVAHHGGTLGSLATPADPGHPRGPDSGVQAAAAYRRTPRPAPTVPPVAVGSVDPSPSPAFGAPPADSGIRADDLAALVADAAARARHLLTGTADSGLFADLAGDVTRRAAAAIHDTERLAGLAAAAAMTVETLEARARAHVVGGSAAAAAADTRWEPDPEVVAPAVAVLGDGARIRANTVTRDGVQLRVDPEGRWWRLEADDRLGWVVAAGPAATPHPLITATHAAPPASATP